MSVDELSYSLKALIIDGKLQHKEQKEGGERLNGILTIACELNYSDIAFARRSSCPIMRPPALSQM